MNKATFKKIIVIIILAFILTGVTWFIEKESCCAPCTDSEIFEIFCEPIPLYCHGWPFVYACSAADTGQMYFKIIGLVGNFLIFLVILLIAWKIPSIIIGKP